MHETLDAAIAKAYEGQETAGVEKSTAYGHPAQALIEASREADLLVVGQAGARGVHRDAGRLGEHPLRQRRVLPGRRGPRRRWPAEPGPLTGSSQRGPRRLLARGQLPVGRPDLPDGQPAADRAAARRAHQAAAARALGHHPRPELRLGAPEPGDHRPRHGDDDRHRARPRRARGAGEHLAGGQLPRGLPERAAGRGGHGRRCSASSPSPAGCPATSRRRRPARSTRAASSATRSRTPTAPRSTTRA